MLMKNLRLWPLWSLMALLAACTPKGLPKATTVNDYREDLAQHRVQYPYSPETFEGNPQTITISLPADTTGFELSITQRLHKVLDTKPVRYVAPISTGTFDGYRIQIYRGRSREEAERAKASSYRIFPKMSAYMTYSAPNYRVKVGDFLEQTEYIKYYNRLKQEFPTAMIVPDKVQIVVVNDPNKQKKTTEEKKKSEEEEEYEEYEEFDKP